MLCSFPNVDHLTASLSHWLTSVCPRIVWRRLAVALAMSSVSINVSSADEPARASAVKPDIIRSIQQKAFEDRKSSLGYWGSKPDNYFEWTSHSNRLIPVYAFGTKGAGPGVDLTSYSSENSLYRSEDKVRALYGVVPEKTVNPHAVWMDQTNIYDIQKAAAEAGRKYVFLVVFDGMDWQTTQAAGIYNSGKVYLEGKGHGTHFQDYEAGGTAQYSFMCTSPHNNGTDVDVNTQTVKNPGGTVRGGYDASVGGMAPWSTPVDAGYLFSRPAEGFLKHAYTDSSSSASSMTAGAKLFNGAINVDPTGVPLETIAHRLQEKGWAVGAVSSVPISHATPACSYAHNVERDDYQDLTRDMLGLPSVAHPMQPLPGLDVVIGGGYGVIAEKNANQGDNYVPGNIYLTEADLTKADVRHDGKYVTAVRTSGQNGAELLSVSARQAIRNNQRLLGFFGNGAYSGHLPFQTADGNYDPPTGVSKKAETYSHADLNENPTLPQMTQAAIDVLASKKKPFWLMVESGDVDWANHDDNIDNSIGAVNSGDAAVKAITDWVDLNSNWNESLVIVTADHGHMWNLTDPETLAKAKIGEK